VFADAQVVHSVNMKRATPVLGLRKPREGAWRAGFTLVELLVVIAVVGILASLLLPALNNARKRGQAVLCMSNHRQLMLACLLYAHDYEDSLPYNFGAAQTKRTVAKQEYLNWVNNVMTWELDPENTNATLITAGGLGPYCSGGISLFKCPVDFVLSEVQRGAGWRARARSISMNAMVGNAGEFSRTGVNTNNPYYRQFFKLSQVPEPAHIFVFIEEHPDSVNDGYFLNRPASREWNDLPASYHSGGANLAFADGHVESHQWLSQSTKPPARPDAAQLPFAVPFDDAHDFDWLMARTSVKGYYRHEGYPTGGGGTNWP
jgi:prepilin-type N-terminal cleavage/methylation domain-containing protein/prepilin-type processing-associated H-X9-DG protein